MTDDAFDRERFPENFYRGVVVRLNRANFSGRVRSESGREFAFQFPFVTVVGAPIGGPAPGFERLQIGAQVGFDVGWSSKGLVVTTIKPL